jgi:hypothetical protein
LLKKKADEELAEERRKTEEEQRKTERVIRQVNKQLGELGNKFGSFTEGMAWPSMEKVLHKHFGMNDISGVSHLTNCQKRLDLVDCGLTTQDT